MEYIIHLTENCNLNCAYCYEKKKDKTKDISFENIKKIIDYEANQKHKKTRIIFYGGEPLLKKDLIKATIEYINSKKCKTKFSYGITTNGTLLDDEFLEYMKRSNFDSIGYSIDGDMASHDLNRCTIDGKGTYNIVKENAKKVLNYFDQATAMMVVTKNNLSMLSASVRNIIDIGFKVINIAFDYTYDWQDEDLEVLKKQLYDVADIYKKMIMAEEDIYIPMIDEKIKSHIDKSYDCNKDCKFATENINIGTDGKLYPCTQFVKNKDFVIGDCDSGIDVQARKRLLTRNINENINCVECTVKSRCKHLCACKNYILTSDINGLSPFTCETERMLIEISDNIANYLYKNNSRMFIQKFYNKKYNLLNQVVERKYKKG